MNNYISMMKQRHMLDNKYICIFQINFLLYFLNVMQRYLYLENLYYKNHNFEDVTLNYLVLK